MGMLGPTDQAGFDLNWEPRLIAIGGPAADVTLSRATQALSVLSNLQNALTRALREGELEGQIDVAARAAFAEAAARAEILERQLDGVVRITQQINETRVAATDRAVNALDAENPGYLSPHQAAIIYNAPEGTTVTWGPITVTASPGAVEATNRMLHNNRERAAQQHIQTVAAEISGVAERLQATLSDDFKFDSGSSGETGGPGATAGNPGGSSLGGGSAPGYNPYFDYPDATSNANAEWPEGVAPTPVVPQAPSDEPTYDYPYDNDVVGQRPDTTYVDYSVTPDSSDDPGSRGWTGYTPNGTGNLSGGGSGYGIGSGVSSGVGSGSSSAMAGVAGAGGGAVSFAGAKMMAQGYTGGGSGLLSRSAMSGGGLRGGGAGGTGAGSAARTGGMAGAGSRGGMGLMGGGANSSAQNGGARGTAARGGAAAGVRGASAGGGAASSTRGTTVNGGAASSTRGSAGNGGAASATRGSAASANGSGGARAGGAGRGGMMGGSGSNEEQRKRSHGMLNGLMAPGLEDDEQLGARSEAAGAGGRED